MMKWKLTVWLQFSTQSTSYEFVQTTRMAIVSIAFFHWGTSFLYIFVSVEQAGI